MTLLKIIFGCFVTIFLFWYSIKYYGEHQRYTAYDHPLVQDIGPWIMAYGGESSEYPSHTKIAIDAALRNPDVWLALDIFMNADHSFYAIPHNYLVKTDKRPWIKWTDGEVEKLDAGEDFQNIEGMFPYRGADLKFLKLEEVINKYPNAQFFLWFRDNERDLDLIIASFLKKYPNLENHILIYSDYDVVMRSLKVQLPRWIYGSAAGERTRFVMFDAIQLQSIATLKGDFYFTPLKIGSVKMMSWSTKHEIERRQMPLILGPLLNDSDIAEAVRFGPRGFITTSSDHLYKILKKLN